MTTTYLWPSVGSGGSDEEDRGTFGFTVDDGYTDLVYEVTGSSDGLPTVTLSVAGGGLPPLTLGTPATPFVGDGETEQIDEVLFLEATGGGYAGGVFLVISGPSEDDENDTFDAVTQIAGPDAGLDQPGGLRAFFDASGLGLQLPSAFPAGTPIPLDTFGPVTVTDNRDAPAGPTEGADDLTGTRGPDEIDGLGGADTIAGGGGADTLLGGVGPDEINGGGGRDSLSGGDGSDLLIGAGGADTLDGGTGADTLRGGGGRDELVGGDGSDALFGNAGGDTLRGGRGDDTLTGGGGRDDFVFGRGDGSDLIVDFRDNKDTLVLDDALWGPDLTARQVISRFATQDGDDVVFDFGRRGSVEIEDVTLREMRNDLDIV